MKDAGYLNPFGDNVRPLKVFEYPHEDRTVKALTDYNGEVWRPVEDDLWVNDNGEHYPWEALVMLMGPLTEVVE